VAELLRAELILPPHYEVANAVGAVAGSVIVNREAWILPHLRRMQIRGYIVQGSDERARFSSLDEALAHARHTLATSVKEEASAAGAVDPVVSFEQLPDGANSYRVRARAIGNPHLGKATEEAQSPSPSMSATRRSSSKP
jgi:hypothetical protein